MHPTRYPTDASRVELVGTLLTGTPLTWFAPLFERNLHCLTISKNSLKSLNKYRVLGLPSIKFVDYDKGITQPHHMQMIF